MHLPLLRLTQFLLALQLQQLLLDCVPRWLDWLVAGRSTDAQLLAEGRDSFKLQKFGLYLLVDLQTLLDHFCKAVYFVDSLSVPLFLLFDDLQRPVLFTKDAEAPFSLYFVDFHEVVGSPRTLNVERDHAFRVLALNASALVFQATYDTLQAETFAVDLV